MFSVKNTLFKVFLAALIITSFGLVRAVYVPTNSDTKEEPDMVIYDIAEPTEMELLHENDNFKYFYRESRGTFAIYDKRNNYTWKTGTDLEYAKDIDDECDDLLDLYELQFNGLDPLTFGNFVFTTTTESTLEGANGRLKAVVEGLTATSTEDDVLITLDGLSLEQTKVYQLSVALRSNEEKDIIVRLGSHLEETITVTPTETVHTFLYTMTAVTDNAVTLSFELGTVDGAFVNTNVFIDDLKLEEYDSALNEGAGDVVVDTNQVTRGDFELLEIEYTTTNDELLAACRPKEVKLNTTYTGFANSLVTIEYYDISNNIKRSSSSAHVSVSSELNIENGDGSHFSLEIDYKKLDIELIVHIYFEETGIRYEVLDDDITGDGVEFLAAIIISPFLGASGGAEERFDLAELDYGDEEFFKDRIPGYTFVPDGSGTLIRFADNGVKLDPYKGAVYGIDAGQKELHYSFSDSYVEFKQPSMPVFGMAHGQNQAAFVAFATEGDEHMQIISMPEENLTYYNFTYPRFEYNKQYLQVYNKSGWGFLTLYEERNHFDIDLTYNFLANNGETGHSADYVGMAKSYRDYLLENDLLHEMDVDYDEVPIRLDFFMSDVEKSIIGYSNMVTTTSTGVDEILNQVLDLGITNVNSGLLGWNDGGYTLGDPSDTDFSRDIGKKRAFESLIKKYQEQNVDISFVNDYYNINEEQMNLRRNAAQHTSTWYAQIDTFNYPINMFYYARPVKSVEWLQDQSKVFKGMGVSSYSIYGISNNLITDYTFDATREDAKMLILDGFKAIGDEIKINAYQPNSFLWSEVDRYLGIPVYGTQYLIESDTVPFLQLVLQGTMEMYGPYSNFSFYTDSDVLRMIDYNIYPSFVLSKEPAHLLSDTNSRNFYSSEYLLYEELIESIYGRVNDALSPVIGAEWIDRTVLENGVILNEYSNGVEIVINYKDEAVTYSGVTVSGNSYGVIGE